MNWLDEHYPTLYLWLFLTVMVGVPLLVGAIAVALHEHEGDDCPCMKEF